MFRGSMEEAMPRLRDGTSLLGEKSSIVDGQSSIVTVECQGFFLVDFLLGKKLDIAPFELPSAPPEEAMRQVCCFRGSALHITHGNQETRKSRTKVEHLD